jgi:hypothetical protein
MNGSIMKRLFLLMTLEALGILTFLLGPLFLADEMMIPRTQLVVIVAFGVIFLSLAFVTVKAYRNQEWLARWVDRVNRKLVVRNRLLVTVNLLIAASLMGIFALVVGQMFASREYQWYESFFQNLLAVQVALVVFKWVSPLLVFAIGVCVQGWITLTCAYRSRMAHRDFWHIKTLFQTWLGPMIIPLTLFHWGVLILCVPMAKVLPGWYWSVFVRPVNTRYLMMFLVFGLVLGVGWVIFRRPKPAWRSLLILIAMGYTLQVGFGLIEGGGYEYIRLKYTDSYHRSYALIASSEPFDPLEAVREYEERYGKEMFPSTKPPGIIVVFKVLEGITRIFHNQTDPNSRFLALTKVMAYVFPLMMSFAVVMIYTLLKVLDFKGNHQVPGFLFLLAPNVILIPMFLDNALYPSLFLMSVLLMVVTVKKKSLIWGIIAGVYLYIVVFFTFSMLPLLPLFLLLVGIDYWLLGAYRNILPYLKVGAGLVSGGLAALGAFRWLLNYDILYRYTTAMRVVRNFDFVLRTGEQATIDLGTTTVIPGLQQILRAAFLNNLELAAAIGIPLFILFLLGAVRTLIRIAKRRATPLEGALGAVFLTYVALNVYGQVQGEVSRLWIFWVPMMMIFAGMVFEDYFDRKTPPFFVLIALQMVTIFLTFQFQDFIM